MIDCCHGRILAFVVASNSRQASSIPRHTSNLAHRVMPPIAGRTPEAAEFVGLSRAVHTASGRFRVIVRGFFSPAICPANAGAA